MKVLLLDKDGTIVRPASGGKWVTQPDDQVLIEGVATAVQKYIDKDWKIAIVSNQAGVAAGHKTLLDVEKELAYALNLLPSEVSTAFACPDFDGQELICVRKTLTGCQRRKHVEKLFMTTMGSISFRKPEPGMLLAAQKFLWDDPLADCVMVGDREEDEQAAYKAGARFLTPKDWFNQPADIQSH